MEGSACVFPFVYNGVEYNACTEVDAAAEGSAWCATELTMREWDETTGWGNCVCDDVLVANGASGLERYESAAACTLCPPGQYDHDSSSTTPCVLCPADTFQATEGSTECSGRCPAGQSSAEGSISADNCTASERAYLGCYNVGGEVSMGAMRNIDLPTESRDVCERLCQGYKFMGFSGADQCSCSTQPSAQCIRKSEKN